MNEFYFLTFIARLFKVECILLIVSSVACLGIWAYWLSCISCDDENEPFFRKTKNRLSVITLILALMTIATPCKQDLMLIYGIGGTIDYIKSNDTAKQLPDKVILAIDNYLDDVNKEERHVDRKK